MKAISIAEFGGPEVLHVVEVPVPEPQEGEILIKVMASGLNFADTIMRKNQYVFPIQLPFVLGAEVAGWVERVGPNTGNYKVGDKVMAMIATQTGGYAQYAVVNAQAVLPVPDTIDFDQATALFVQGITAYLLLTDAVHVGPNSTIVIHAGAGGVGSLLIQMAKELRVGKIIATASTEEKMEQARKFGAHEAIDYTESGWSEKLKQLTNNKGADVIFDMVGGDVFTESLKGLAFNGTLVYYGNAAGKPTHLDASAFLSKGLNQSVSTFYVGSYFTYRPEKIFSGLQAIVQLVNEGKLVPYIGLSLPLEKASEAHYLLENRKTSGKVVLHPWN